MPVKTSRPHHTKLKHVLRDGDRVQDKVCVVCSGPVFKYSLGVPRKYCSKKCLSEAKRARSAANGICYFCKGPVDSGYKSCHKCRSNARSNRLRKIASVAPLSGRDCIVCGEHKPSSEFGKNPAAIGGLRLTCKSCGGSGRTSKECASCLKEREIECYGFNSQALDGRESSCKICRAAAKLGSPWQVIDFLVRRSGMNCYICNKKVTFRKGSMTIDHNHSTGEVRGMLCSNCNLLLGHCRERTDVLESAIGYLKNPPSRSLQMVA